MNIVIPLAGAGSRFTSKGWTQPKMLLEAAGRPMLYWALDSLEPYVNLSGTIFVCLNEHLEHYPLAELIRAYVPDAVLVGIDGIRNGQALTVLEAAPYMQLTEPLLIYNCDTYTRLGSDSFRLAGGADGVISVFPSSSPAYSYVRVQADGYVTEVREKEVISAYASTGLYHFERAEDFVQAAGEAAARWTPEAGECYVAPLYNQLMAKGYRYRIARATGCYPLGTPQQLEEFARHAHQWTAKGREQL